MAEYIDRDAAVDAVTDIYYDTPEINLTAEKFEAAINGIPAADVAPVAHGWWENSTDEWFGTDSTLAPNAERAMCLWRERQRKICGTTAQIVDAAWTESERINR